MVLKPLSGRISRSSAQSLGSSYRRYASYTSLASLLSKPVISRAHHPCKSQAVGFYRCQFLLHIQHIVLPSYARAMEINIHTSYLCYQTAQLCRRILIVYIYLLIAHDATISHSHNLLKFFDSSAGYSHFPSFGSQVQSHLLAYARSGSHHYCFHSSFSFSVVIIFILCPK